MDERKQELFYTQKNGYDLMSVDERRLCEDYCKGYMRYLDAARTEREAVREAIALAEAAGFAPLDESMTTIAPGQKVYYNNRGKSLILAVGGKKPMSAGCVIGAAHVDAPRLDLKQLPLYEDSEFATSAPTTTAESRNTSGRPSRLSCMVASCWRMAAPWM